LITENYLRVMDDIQQAALAAGREPDSVRLVVVTKGHDIQSVQEVIQAGAHWLGENYVEEALPKIAAQAHAAGVEWHMIGHVQSRKAQSVYQNFTMLHALDSLKLARRLDRFASEQGQVFPVLLECNVSGEESKYGWAAWDEARWETLLPELAEISALAHLKVRGLMTMAPYSEESEHSRPFFQRLRRLSSYLADCLPAASWSELSMGMSGDYQVAIQEGATILRIGTAIMGLRPCAVNF
jgi:pyridoxal phosphate enzyme (YggS family)